MKALYWIRRVLEFLFGLTIPLPGDSSLNCTGTGDIPANGTGKSK